MDNTSYILIYEQKKGMRSAALNGNVSIGRKSGEREPKICLDSSIVSRNHGELCEEAGGYRYRDCGSANGTYINGQLYGSRFSNQNADKGLEHGDCLRIDCPNGHEPHPEAVLMIYFKHYDDKRPWKEEAFPACGQAWETKDLPLKLDWHQGRLIAEPDGRGRGGTVFLNQETLTGPAYLYPFDVIRAEQGEKQVCIVVLENRFLLHEEIEKKEMGKTSAADVLDAMGLHIWIRERSVRQNRQKRLLLQNIRLDVANGEMVLILGGSGAGKTTFLNAVMGYEKADGTILYGDTDIYEDYDQMKYKIGFVPQKDLLRLSDRVYDTLKNAARMKLPRQTAQEERDARIEAVLDLFGLAREKELLVSKLSGGQRKRLSIAVEYISDPVLFFLDEPDSGLDGIMARSLMENLRAIAARDKIVMVITHGPDRAADLFDKVVVLAKSARDNCGHLAYYGPVAEAYGYFDTGTLEGVVKRINRPDEGGDGMSDYYINKYLSWEEGKG